MVTQKPQDVHERENATLWCVHTCGKQPKHEVVEHLSVLGGYLCGTDAVAKRVSRRCGLMKTPSTRNRRGVRTGVAADASGQNALSCWGSSAPGGASIYSTNMQMPTVSRASTWPGNSGAGSGSESSDTTGCCGGAGGGEASRMTSSFSRPRSQSSTVLLSDLTLEFLRSHWSRRRFILFWLRSGRRPALRTDKVFSELRRLAGARGFFFFQQWGSP